MMVQSVSITVEYVDGETRVIEIPAGNLVDVEHTTLRTSHDLEIRLDDYRPPTPDGVRLTITAQRNDPGTPLIIVRETSTTQDQS